MAFCVYIICRVERIFGCPGVGGRSRHLFDVNRVLWAQFYAESHSRLLPDKPASHRVQNRPRDPGWPGFSNPRQLWSKKAFSILATPDTAALSGERLPHPSARLAFPSIFTGKHRHVTATAARYGGNLDLRAIYIASLSLDSGFDTVIYSVVDIHISEYSTRQCSGCQTNYQETLLCVLDFICCFKWIFLLYFLNY